jgi:hypothetical protein
MLPSFRLIATAFLCGFVLVFAGLRLATSLNTLHEGFPLMAAHAAPAPIAGAAAWHAVRPTVPALYDLRFVVRPIKPTPVGLSSAANEEVASETAPAAARAAPVISPAALAAMQYEAAARVQSTLRRSPSESKPALESAAQPDVKPSPQPAVAAIDPQPAPSAQVQSKPASPDDSAAIDSPPSSPPEPAASEPVSPPAAVAAVEPAAVATAPDQDPIPAAAAASPAPKPKAAAPAPKAAVRKRARTARRAAPKNTFGAFNDWSGNRR